MDVLTLSTVCILCTSPPADLSATVAQWQPLIAEASARFGVPERWIARVMTAESGGHTTLNGKPITSTAGAMGLMQVMPKTYADLRQRFGLGADPYAVRDNIFAGTAYLRLLYERYGYPNLFAAYNAGPGRMDDYLLRGRPLPAQTTAYIASLIPGLAALDGPQSAPLVRGPTRLHTPCSSRCALRSRRRQWRPGHKRQMSKVITRRCKSTVIPMPGCLSF